jgi:hypothetical protein
MITETNAVNTLIVLCLALVTVQGIMWRMIDNAKQDIDSRIDALFAATLTKFLETDRELTNLKEKNKKNGTTKKV